MLHKRTVFYFPEDSSAQEGNSCKNLSSKLKSYELHDGLFKPGKDYKLRVKAIHI